MGAVLRFQNLPGRVGRKGVADAVAALVSEDPVAVGFAEGRHIDFGGTKGYTPHTWTDVATPTLIRSDCRVIGAREELAYDNEDVGPWGAGPRVMAAAWPHLVKIESPDARPFWFGNNHLVPSVTRPARKDDEVMARDERRGLHRRELLKMVRNAGGLSRVVYVADWNCSPSYEDVEILTSAGFKIVSVGATHEGGSEIDWWAVRGVKVLSSRKLGTNGSDHHGIEIEIR